MHVKPPAELAAARSTLHEAIGAGMSKVAGGGYLPGSPSQAGIRPLVPPPWEATDAMQEWVRVALGGSFLFALDLLSPVAGLCSFLTLHSGLFGQVCVEKGLGGTPSPGQPLALCHSWLFHSLAELGEEADIWGFKSFFHSPFLQGTLPISW